MSADLESIPGGTVHEDFVFLFVFLPSPLMLFRVTGELDFDSGKKREKETALDILAQQQRWPIKTEVLE